MRKKNRAHENTFQRFIIKELKRNGSPEERYIERDKKNYDKKFACDKELLFRFLNNTQPDEMADLRRERKGSLEHDILVAIDTAATNGSLLKVLKDGITVGTTKLELMYKRPASTMNEELLGKYKNNIFSVMEEVVARPPRNGDNNDDGERIDLVIFLNGLAIMAFELKYDGSGQHCIHAISQFREDRNPKTRLFWHTAGVLVNFAMDIEEVYMTTKLEEDKTSFLPFNKGVGEGVNVRAGNPECKDGSFRVSYMWKDLLKKDTIIDLISHFIFENTDKNGMLTERFFPRYHQLDVIRKILEDVRNNKTEKNYLIQHSAGSGKTKTIAWLAYRLASLHDANNNAIFNKVVVITDRIVVDEQLQKALLVLNHEEGYICVIDEKCSSDTLAKALSRLSSTTENTGRGKIIVATIQKSRMVLDKVKNLKEMTFAVIIDEAHSSTAGKSMTAITQAFSSAEHTPDDVEEQIMDELRGIGKPRNVSMFAFTATPKDTTLEFFGKKLDDGSYEAFHVYSMKQAIEEEFIYDVTANYTTYKTFCEINKETLDDPIYDTSIAKRKISQIVNLQDENIEQRTEVIVEHFRQNVMQMLDGTAKAMVVTESREMAVRYHHALREYAAKKGYTKIKALVAFSGEVGVKLPGDNKKQNYTEAGINEFSEDKLPDKFDKEGYNVLVVADKYQTGFDQPKLCAMYVLKKLNRVAAVQTLSRLNRICPPYRYEEKKTFVLDFENSYEDIKEAFAPYYTTTLLVDSPALEGDLYKNISNMVDEIDSYAVLDQNDIEEMNEKLFYKKGVTEDEWLGLSHLYCLRVRDKICEKYKKTEERAKITTAMSRFVHYYNLILQAATCREGAKLSKSYVNFHKKYNFITELLPYIRSSNSGKDYNLEGKIRGKNFVQIKTEEHYEGALVSKPGIERPMPREGSAARQSREEPLSMIIAKINSKIREDFDDDVPGDDEEIIKKKLYQIVKFLKGSDGLKTSAMSNDINNFKWPYIDSVEEVLKEEYKREPSRILDLLLNDKDLREQTFEYFRKEIYESLRV